MKLLPLLAIIIFFSLIGVISSCKKTHTVFETTTVTVHDTTRVNVHDTTIIRDSIYDFSDGLVAYYPFTGGSLSDSSGYKNNIIFNTATKTADRFGNPDNAYLFDGTSGYMQVKNSYSLNPNNITIYTIVKVNGFYTGTCGGNQILSKGYPYDTYGFYHLAFFTLNGNCGTPDISNEVFSAGYGDDVPQGALAAVSDNTPIITTQWYYVVYTYDGLAAKLYINGQLKNTTQKSVGFTDNTNDLFIGKHENPLFPYYFNGVIDEIRIYNRALKADAINHLIKLKN